MVTASGDADCGVTVGAEIFSLPAEDNRAWNLSTLAGIIVGDPHYDRVKLPGDNGADPGICEADSGVSLTFAAPPQIWTIHHPSL